ncbi:MAG: dihydrolipoyl dehydrogenase [Deltaproteobacteria bacterium]|nr:dihydrolipoyl dehydrogenase [Deltaproteobacteria bacterium]
MVVGDLAESTEVAVIGAGPGGYVAAIRAAQLGKEVTIINAEALPGGVCLLRGCIPSKALIEAANLLHRIPYAAEMGIKVEGLSVDWPALQKWKDGVVQKLGKGVEQLLKQNGVRTLAGSATFLDAHTLEVQTSEGLRRVAFEKAILATGSRPRSLPSLEFDGKNVISSDEALKLAEIPASLLVVGGGYIGLELGEVYAKLGSRVILVEALPELLSGTDPALLRPVKKKLAELKMDIRLETQVQGFTTNGDGLEVRLKGKDGTESTVSVSKILVAIGRAPNSEGLGLERAGIRLDAKGFVSVNAKQETSSPHVYAIGDVAGGILLAHKASREGLVAAANIAGHAEAFDNQVPAVIFTDPEIAYVGLSEAQAKERGIETTSGMFGFGANGRALTMNETEGFVKVIAEKSSKRILGVQMVGPHVSDLISEATLALEMGAFIDDLELTIHPHPTLSEALHEAADGVLGMSIHRYQKIQKDK